MYQVALSRFAVVLLAAMALTATANDFSLDWFSVDAGGGMLIVGGEYALSATIGQVDAGTRLAGGEFALAGGFWPAMSGPAICRGDLNCDDQIDFADINPFVLALSNWSAWLAQYPDCPPKNADINQDGLYGGEHGFGDINPFVALLSSGGGKPIPCP